MSRYGYRIKLTAIAALGAVFTLAAAVPAAQADGRHTHRWQGHGHWHGDTAHVHHKAHRKAHRKAHHRAHKKAKRIAITAK